jgi:broad specificity phosphatase PhoE
MRLFLVRHARTAWNAEMRAQGHTDIPLDAEGERQAVLLAQAFRHIHVDQIISSDLGRTVTTARAVHQVAKCELTLEPLLRERAYGEWEGKFFHDFRSTLEKLQAKKGVGLFEARPPGGESLNDIWSRVAPVSKSLRKAGGSLVVVTHGGVCAVLLAQLLKGTIETSRSFRFSNASVTELLLRPEGDFHLVRFNDTAHLTAAVGLADAAAS